LSFRSCPFNGFNLVSYYIRNDVPDAVSGNYVPKELQYELTHVYVSFTDVTLSKEAVHSLRAAADFFANLQHEPIFCSSSPTLRFTDHMHDLGQCDRKMVYTMFVGYATIQR